MIYEFKLSNDNGDDDDEIYAIIHIVWSQCRPSALTFLNTNGSFSKKKNKIKSGR